MKKILLGLLVMMLACVPQQASNRPMRSASVLTHYELSQDIASSNVCESIQRLRGNWAHRGVEYFFIDGVRVDVSAFCATPVRFIVTITRLNESESYMRFGKAGMALSMVTKYR